MRNTDRATNSPYGADDAEVQTKRARNLERLRAMRERVGMCQEQIAARRDCEGVLQRYGITFRTTTRTARCD
jgi:hypothetical protein